METSLTGNLLGIASIAIFVLMNAFFVAAEFALVSVRRTRVAEMVSTGQAGAEAVQRAISNPDQVIAATQLGITLASLALGWIGEPAFSRLLSPLFALLPTHLQTDALHTVSAVIAFSLITFLHVVVGELAPKSIALQDPERTALFVAGPTLLTEKIFKPAIWVLNGAGSSLLRLVGVRATSGHGLVHSVEELKMLVDASTQGGVMEVEESNMLHGVFDMRELIVRQVMIPRTEIEAIELHTPLDEVIAHAIESSYTKFPVYKENLDEIVGIIHIKDVLIAMREPERQDRTAADIKREALFVPDTIEVNALLSLFRDKRQHIAIALDEFGGTAGIVTLEDLLEEIVGEVSGPFDPGAPDIQEQPDGSILIDGLTLIEEVNEKLKLTIVEDYYDTIAGYILGKLNHVPKEGEYYDEGSLRLLVEEMDKMRIARVRLYTNRPASPGATTSAEDPPPADAPSGDAKAGR